MWFISGCTSTVFYGWLIQTFILYFQSGLNPNGLKSCLSGYEYVLT